MLANPGCDIFEALCCMQAQRKEFNAQEPRYETSKPPYPSGQLSFGLCYVSNQHHQGASSWNCCNLGSARHMHASLHTCRATQADQKDSIPGAYSHQEPHAIARQACRRCAEHIHSICAHCWGLYLRHKYRNALAGFPLPPGSFHSSRTSHAGPGAGLNRIEKRHLYERLDPVSSKPPSHNVLRVA